MDSDGPSHRRGVPIGVRTPRVILMDVSVHYNMHNTREFEFTNSESTSVHKRFFFLRQDAHWCSSRGSATRLLVGPTTDV